MRGCFFGLAIGDALGRIVEYQSPGSFTPIYGFRSRSPMTQPIGVWSEDTAMAVALADSISNCSWDINDQMQRYLDWWRNGKYALHGKCTQISNTMSSALYHYEQNRDPETSGQFAASPESNGAIARLAPVVVHFGGMKNDEFSLSDLASESSRPTHVSLQSQSACSYFSLILEGLLLGESRDVVLSPTWAPYQQLSEQELHSSVGTVLKGSFRQLQPPEIQASYYASKCLEAALWAFDEANSFSEALIKAVNLGHDSNTVGAVCGQLAGAYWGCAGIPSEWLDALAGKDILEYAFAGLQKQDY